MENSRSFFGEREELKAYKTLVQIDDLLDIDTFSDDVAESKPHPYIFIAAVKRLGQVGPNE